VSSRHIGTPGHSSHRTGPQDTLSHTQTQTEVDAHCDKVFKVVLENFSFQHCERPLVTERVATGDIYSLYGTSESSDHDK